MADITEIQLKKAIQFALGSFADYESEEERRKFLRQNFTAVPGLKTYFGFSEDKLQDALSALSKQQNLLQEKENLLLAQQLGEQSLLCLPAIALSSIYLLSLLFLSLGIVAMGSVLRPRSLQLWLRHRHILPLHHLGKEIRASNGLSQKS